LSIAKLDITIQDIGRNKVSLVKNRDNADVKKEKNDAITKLMNRVSAIKKYVSEAQEKEETRTLNLLRLELNAAIHKTSFANIRCEIDRDTYAVKVIDEATGLERPKLNSGEVELIKTCLIACVIGQASKKSLSRYKSIARATSAPLVIDAPFTKMDVEYIKGSLGMLIDKTEQLILLSLPTDYMKYEDQALTTIGKKYVLIKADKGPKGNKEIAQHKIFGETIDFVSYDNVDELDEESVTQSKVLEIK